MSINMVADHARWPIANDPIFEISGRAKKAIDEFGKENVIDATLGALYDDDGNLICMDSVYTTLKNMPNEKIAAYAPLAGTPGFLNAVETACFGDYKPDAHIRSVATPGGTGGVKHAICNYTNSGDAILVGDWYWSPYATISEEIGRTVQTFTLFNEEGNFNIISFKEHFEALMKKQKRVLTILNTPAHNPTGYSISDEEWDEILDIFKNAAKDENNRVILLVDTAYIDFAGEGQERRKFFKKFSNLPENLFVMIAYSMSKGYTMYGMRSGAAIGISSNEDLAIEFQYSCMHSGRANWSNGTRGAMEVMSTIYADPDKLKAYLKEVEENKQMLQERAKIFVDEAQKVGLKTLPYRDGFFITIEHPEPKKLMEELTKQNLYLVSLKKGIRFAICAVSGEKCRKSAAIIKKAMDDLK